MAGWTQEALLDALLMMRGAGMVDYGRFPSDSKGMNYMRKAYAIALEPVGDLDNSVIGAATTYFIRNESDFPSAAAFAERCKMIVESATKMIGVHREEGTMSIVRVPGHLSDEASMALAREKLGLQPLPTPRSALAGPERTADLYRRMDGLAGKVPDAKDEAA